MSLRIIQISDCHLFADPAAQLKGICTQERLNWILQALRTERQQPDLLILTGDLTHDEKRETYSSLHQQLAPWREKLRVLAGNHDDRAGLSEFFPQPPMSDEGRILFAENAGNWKLIGLDSQLTGASKGFLGKVQLNWLASQLAAQPTHPTALFLHHPPVQVGSLWLDQIGLEDAAEFWEVIMRFSQVKVICAGHVHQELAITRGNVLVLATPSTGVQFLPQASTLAIDSVPPGFRVMELDDSGEVRTRVVRITQ